MASASMERRAEAIFWRSPGRDPHRRVRRVAPAGGVMSVLARFSTSPLRSRDAAVRLRGVQKHPVEDTAPLAELARSDPDARVRREAVRRLEAPRVLLELVETAGDEDARKLARSRSEALLVKIAADSRDLEESRRALGLLEPLRAVADVVCRAHFEAVRTEAMERLVAPPARGGAEDVVGPRDLALAQVAARGGDPAMRGRALGAILTPAGLAQVAVSAGGRESASAAVRRIEDPDELLRVAESGAVRSVRRLARRLAEERLPPDHPERVRSRESDLLPRLERLESGEATATERSRLLSEVDAVLATGPVGEAASERVEAARARALRLEQEAQAAPRLRLPDAGADAAPDAPQAVVRPEPPVPEEVREILERLEDPESELSLGELDDLSRRAFLRLDDPPPRPAAKARLAAALRSSRDQAHDRRRRRVDAFDLAEMADHAAALHRELADPEGSGRSKRGRGDPVRARRELARLNRRFERLDLQDTPDGERFREAAAKAEALLVAAEAAREKRQRKTSERIAALDERLETLEKAESPSLPQIEGALRDLGALRADSEAWRAAGPAGQARFQRFQASLMPRLRESRELREWKRWSNLESQADIIRRGKALLEEEDAVRVDRGLVRLERSWRESRHADPDRGQELWEEWGQVRDALLERARPVREERDRAMAEQVAALEALAARAEALAETPDPGRLAEMRGLMPEWKTRSKGLPRGKAEALWKRFRAANSQYFDALSEVRAERKKRFEELAANIPAREEIISRAKALAGSVEPAAVGASVRELIAEWKAAPPVPRKAGDRLWEAFSAALDAARDDARRRRYEDPEGPDRGEVEEETEELVELRGRVVELVEVPDAERAEAAGDVFAELRRLARAGRPSGSARRTRTSPLDRVAADLERALGKAFEAAPATFAGTRFDQDELEARLGSLAKRLDDVAPAHAGKPPTEGGAASLAAHLQASLGSGRAADRDAEAREAARAAAELLERARAAGPAFTPGARKLLASLERRVKQILGAAPPPLEARERGRGFRPRGRGAGRGAERRRGAPSRERVDGAAPAR